MAEVLAGDAYMIEPGMKDVDSIEFSLY